MKPTIAISVGDLNGVGIEIILKSHNEILKVCTPIYCISDYMLQQAAELLNKKIPKNFQTYNVTGNFTIEAGKVSVDAGKYSYNSFLEAIHLCETKEADTLVTLPINKEAWMLCGLNFKGHTDLLRKHFHKDAIMMLGCKKMFVALYTEHIPLKDVAKSINEKDLETFLLDFYKNIGDEKVAVLGLNPHAGDNGVLGNEEREIESAIASVNKEIGKNIFDGAIVPDVAFSPNFRKNYIYFIAMYHDQGLAPLKALYFDESINVSLNLPIIRVSVDHGTAFDIAYKNLANTKSYLNAIEYAIRLT